MTNNWLKLLDKTFVVKMLVLITVQQGLIACGSAALAIAGQNISEGRIFIVWVGIHLALTLIPHLITVAIRKTEQEGYLAAYQMYVWTRCLRFQGSPAKWQNRQNRDKFATAIGPDSESYITALTYCGFDLYLFVLSIAFNVVAIAIVIDAKFGLVFSASCLLSYLVFSLARRNLENVIEQEQQSKLKIFAYLQNAWDNVLLRNTPVNTLYLGKLETKFVVARSNAKTSAGRAEGLVFLLTLISSLPVFGLTVWLAAQNIANAAFLAGMLATIPRQLGVLTSFRSLFQQITNFTMLKKRLESYWEASELEAAPLESRIEIAKISVNGKAFASLTHMVEALTSLKSGRFTITGANGAGKSTLLLYLNSRLSESFYLPAAPNFEIAEDVGSESTGQRMLKHLRFATEKTGSVLLLDEWDANLDAENTDRLHSEIEDISKHRVVVEVRHA